MKNSFIGIKNYVTIYKSRLTTNVVWVDAGNTEMIDVLDSIQKFIESIEKEFEQLENRILELEGKSPSNKSGDSLVNSVLSKIDILKNLIKSKLGSPDDALFSLNLTNVEAIEQEIKEFHTVTKQNLEKLNKIYLSERNQI